MKVLDPGYSFAITALDVDAQQPHIVNILTVVFCKHGAET